VEVTVTLGVGTDPHRFVDKLYIYGTWSVLCVGAQGLLAHSVWRLLSSSYSKKQKPLPYIELQTLCNLFPALTLNVCQRTELNTGLLYSLSDTE